MLRSLEPLRPHVASVVQDFRANSDAFPNRPLVAEKDEDGGWNVWTWGETRTLVDRIAAGLISRGLCARPVMILSGNSRLHLAVTLAAMTVGVPVAPTSVAYSLQSTDHAKLRAMAALADPGVIFVEDSTYSEAVTAVAGERTVLSGDGGIRGSVTVNEFCADADRDVADRFAALTTGTIAKILFTSGSTGTPKGVITTHGMLAANQQQIRQIWPWLEVDPPLLLDWLPWSHTFGGSHNVNLVLTHGGTLWIDDGRPAPNRIERTVRNLQQVRPTAYFNVPAGYAALLPYLEGDDAAAKAFFSRLRIGFFAAAALPQQLWDRMEGLAARHGGSMQMTTSWGLPETSPAATSAHYPITRSDILGLPLPGVELALVPVGDKLEARVRGFNVTPGYHRNPEATKAAFDEEGFPSLDAGEVTDKGYINQRKVRELRAAQVAMLSAVPVPLQVVTRL